MESDVINRSLYSLGALAILAIFAIGSIDSNTTPSTTKSNTPTATSTSDQLAELTTEYEAAGKKLRIVSSNWEPSSTHDGAVWHVTIENTADKAIGYPGFITKYADRYDQVLEVNDSNYRKRDVVKVVIQPHQRQKLKFQEDFSEPESIMKADKGAIRIDGASWVGESPTPEIRKAKPVLSASPKRS
jgi:hypothetical protein